MLVAQPPDAIDLCKHVDSRKEVRGAQGSSSILFRRAGAGGLASENRLGRSDQIWLRPDSPRPGDRLGMPTTISGGRERLTRDPR